MPRKLAKTVRIFVEIDHISTNILMVLANFLGIHNSILSKNIGRDRGNTRLNRTSFGRNMTLDSENYSLLTEDMNPFYSLT